MNSRTQGYAMAVLAAALWGLQGALAKWLFQGPMSPELLVQYRLTLGALVYGAYLCVNRPQAFRIKWKHIPIFIGLGIGGNAANFYLYYLAIDLTTVSTAILLQYMAPLLIAVVSCLLFKEKFSRTLATALAFSLFGAYLVVGGLGDKINFVGVLAGLGAAIAYTWWSLIGDFISSRYSVSTCIFYGIFIAAIFWNLIYSPLNLFQPLPTQSWVGIGYVTAFGTVLPLLFYFSSMRIIGPTRASITAMLEPVMASFFAFLLVGEILGHGQLLGGLIVIATIIRLKLSPVEAPMSDQIPAPKQASAV